jgi:hypothetical protein
VPGRHPRAVDPVLNRSVRITGGAALASRIRTLQLSSTSRDVIPAEPLAYARREGEEVLPARKCAEAVVKEAGRVCIEGYGFDWMFSDLSTK